MKKIKQYWKIILLILIALSIVIAALSYLALRPFQNNKPVNTIKTAWFDYNTLAKNRSKLITTDFEEDVLVKDYEYRFVQTKFDIFKPVYTYLGRLKTEGDLPKDQTYIQFRVIYLEREGLDNWKVVDNKDGDIKKQTLDEATNLASRYDLTTSFPGKENYKITNYEPLTQSEIDANRKLRDKDTNLETNWIFVIDKLDKIRSKTTPNPEKITILKEIKAELEKGLNLLKNNQNYATPAGNTITPNPDTIKYGQELLYSANGAIETLENPQTQSAN